MLKILSQDQLKTIKGMLNNPRFSNMRSCDLSVLALRFWPSLRDFPVQDVNLDISMVRESRDVESNIPNYAKDQGE